MSSKRAWDHLPKRENPWGWINNYWIEDSTIVKGTRYWKNTNIAKEKIYVQQNHKSLGREYFPTEVTI